jgi:hypothetical protein
MSFDTDADLISIRYITITIPYPLYKYYSEKFCGSSFFNPRCRILDLIPRIQEKKKAINAKSTVSRISNPGDMVPDNGPEPITGNTEQKQQVKTTTVPVLVRYLRLAIKVRTIQPNLHKKGV